MYSHVTVTTDKIMNIAVTSKFSHALFLSIFSPLQSLVLGNHGSAVFHFSFIKLFGILRSTDCFGWISSEYIETGREKKEEIRNNCKWHVQSCYFTLMAIRIYQWIFNKQILDIICISKFSAVSGENSLENVRLEGCF